MNVNKSFFIAISSATSLYIVYNKLKKNKIDKENKIDKATQTGEDEAINKINQEENDNNKDTEKKEISTDIEKNETSTDTEKNETNTDVEKNEINTDTEKNNETEKHLSENIKFNYISFVKNIIGIGN